MEAEKGAFFKENPDEDWVIREKCWQGNVWPALYPTVCPFYGTVNINVHTCLALIFVIFISSNFLMAFVGLVPACKYGRHLYLINLSAFQTVSTFFFEKVHCRYH